MIVSEETNIPDYSLFESISFPNFGDYYSNASQMSFEIGNGMNGQIQRVILESAYKSFNELWHALHIDSPGFSCFDNSDIGPTH